MVRRIKVSQEEIRERNQEKPFKEQEIFIGSTEYRFTAKIVAFRHLANGMGDQFEERLYELPSGNFRVYKERIIGTKFTNVMTLDRVKKKYPDLARCAGLADVVNLD